MAKKRHKKGQAPHSTQLLRLPLLPSGPHGVHPIVVAWDPTLNLIINYSTGLSNDFFKFYVVNKFHTPIFLTLPFPPLII